MALGLMALGLTYLWGVIDEVPYVSQPNSSLSNGSLHAIIGLLLCLTALSLTALYLTAISPTDLRLTDLWSAVDGEPYVSLPYGSPHNGSLPYSSQPNSSDLTALGPTDLRLTVFWSVIDGVPNVSVPNGSPPNCSLPNGSLPNGCLLTAFCKTAWGQKDLHLTALWSVVDGVP